MITDITERESFVLDYLGRRIACIRQHLDNEDKNEGGDINRTYTASLVLRLSEVQSIYDEINHFLGCAFTKSDLDDMAKLITKYAHDVHVKNGTAIT